MANMAEMKDYLLYQLSTAIFKTVILRGVSARNNSNRNDEKDY
tara:strand:- start:499 stop:627 length:129 start_codon:yes stop_codon:yes gene_type:complete